MQRSGRTTPEGDRKRPAREATNHRRVVRQCTASLIFGQASQGAVGHPQEGQKPLYENLVKKALQKYQQKDMENNDNNIEHNYPAISPLEPAVKNLAQDVVEKRPPQFAIQKVIQALQFEQRYKDLPNENPLPIPNKLPKLQPNEIVNK